VLGLREAVENLTVVMGWEQPEAGDVVAPADGEWIYHSGDHATWSKPPNQAFRSNIDRMASAAGRLDLAFISSFGRRSTRGGLNPGDVYTMRTLKPQVTFPMHCGDRENKYVLFAVEATSQHLPTRVAVADVPGAFFHYRDGRLE
jgi:hypothetical protein